MNIRILMSSAALFALVSSGALAQTQNNVDTVPPTGSGCTGAATDPVDCPREAPSTTIPEEQTAPDVNTQSGSENGTTINNNADDTVNQPSPSAEQPSNNSNSNGSSNNGSNNNSNTGTNGNSSNGSGSGGTTP